MRTQIAKWVLAVSLILSIGAQWAVLQSIAWVGMIVKYSQDVSIPVAIKMTFDGKHRCALCKAVEKGRTAEKESQNAKIKSEGKMIFLADSSAPYVPLNLQFEAPLLVCSLDLLRSEPPPIPPPRLA